MDNYTLNPADDDVMFLTAQEVEYLQDINPEPPGFIADFVEWAGKQSDPTSGSIRAPSSRGSDRFWILLVRTYVTLARTLA